MQRQEYSVNFFPINRKPIYIGIKFNRTLINVYESSNPQNSSTIRCINNVSPVAPPGYSPPVRTKVLIFSAIITDAAQMTTIRFASSLKLNFICSLQILLSKIRCLSKYPFGASVLLFYLYIQIFSSHHIRCKFAQFPALHSSTQYPYAHFRVP